MKLGSGSAAPVAASHADAERLYGALGVRELIDLRSSDELRMQAAQQREYRDDSASAGASSDSGASDSSGDPSEPPAFAGIGFCRFVRDPVTRRALPDAPSTVVGERDVMRVHIAPLEK